MGHLGLTPQSATMLGGFKAQGRTAEKAVRLYEDALALEAAGCFAIVLEAVPAPVAARITEALTVPTIGIGAGAGTDGQVLVWHDLLGLYEGHAPRFVKQYADLAAEIKKAVGAYVEEVRERRFPEEQHTYAMPEEELGDVRGGAEVKTVRGRERRWKRRDEPERRRASAASSSRGRARTPSRAARRPRAAEARAQRGVEEVARDPSSSPPRSEEVGAEDGEAERPEHEHRERQRRYREAEDVPRPAERAGAAEAARAEIERAADDAVAGEGDEAARDARPRRPASAGRRAGRRRASAPCSCRARSRSASSVSASTGSARASTSSRSSFRSAAKTDRGENSTAGTPATIAIRVHAPRVDASREAKAA